MSLTHYLHIFSHKTLKKNRALNALSLLHCTPYTENKKYFWYFLCFLLYLPKGIYLCLFTTSRPRAYLIYLHAKHKRRQASKQPSGYTREAYTPSGYTLRLRHTRNIRYAHTHNSKSNFFIRKCSQNLRISKKCSIFAPNLQIAWK